MATEEIGLKVKFFRSIDELVLAADAWDDLWRRSDAPLPRGRAHLLALWHEAFAQQSEFLALAVEEDGRLLTGIPLVTQKYRGVFNYGALASNSAATGGDLLLDSSGDTRSALRVLVSALSRLPFVFLSFEGIPFDEPRWKALIGAMEEEGLAVHLSEDHRIGRIELRQSWAQYEAGLSRNHRHNRRKQARLLEEGGGATLRVHSTILANDLVPLLQRGFEVEDRSWKGDQGSSVLKSQGMFEFFCREAARLADLEMLELVFLEHAGKPISFLYCVNSRGVRYTPKFGYDEAFRQFGPTHQLLLQFLQYLREREDAPVLDFHGPLVPWMESWATTSYPVGRLVSTTSHPVSKMLFNMNYKLRPYLGRRSQGGG